MERKLARILAIVYRVFVCILILHELKFSSVQQVLLLDIRLVALFKANLQQSRSLEDSSYRRAVVDTQALDSPELPGKNLLDV